MTPPSQRILFLSNGHGEDNHSSYIIQALRELCPSIDIVALAIVGEGSAYKRVGVPLIGPTQSMPSGGFSYVNRWRLLDDIRSGLSQILVADADKKRTHFISRTG